MIITLDLDYMFPNNKSIYEFYNVENFENQTTDIQHLDFVIELLNGKNVMFLDTHDQIVEYIASGDIVINIDHHHDLLYDDRRRYTFSKWQLMPRQEKEASWAYYSIIKKKIKYFWCKNNNSYEDINLMNVKFKYITEEKILQLKENCDTIYVIKSLDYINKKQFLKVVSLIGHNFDVNVCL